MIRTPRTFGSRAARRLAGLSLLAFLCGSLSVVAAPAPEPAATIQQQELYRTLTLRAAPGELAAVIEMIGERMPDWQRLYGAGPWWMRHSQGDQWDLLLLFPLGRGFDHWYGEAELARRRAISMQEPEPAFAARLLPKLAWQEETFVWGPAAEVVASRFAEAGYFHVEMFVALAGRRGELVREREMENDYLVAIDRPSNLIFTRAAGAPWDCYTIGFYRDLKHFAESADVPAELEETAAVAAGFESASTIGTYLRELIAAHHDTLAVAIR